VEAIRSKGITDQNILDAIAGLPRHYFLPPEFESHAYEDKAFPIGLEQTISQPFTVAYQTRLLELEKGDKVLEIGTGSGYQACVLALCGAKVHSIERIEHLSDKASALINLLKGELFPELNIEFYKGDGTKGLSSQSPYDKILVTAGAPSIPKTLVNQLVPGGILVIPVGKTENGQTMVRIRKDNNEQISTETFDRFNFVPLVKENGWN
jgi:protein-L-isoaspartate(D-aspartate) O-methyltransferase